MQFPNLYKGTRKLFVSEIISVISSFLSLTGAFASIIFLFLENEIWALIFGGVALVAVGLSIFAFIFKLIGLHQGGKDDFGWQRAFWLVFVSIAFTITASILSSIKAVNEVIPTLLECMSDAADVIVTVNILTGVGVASVKLDNIKFAHHGQRISYFFVALFIVAMILDLIPSVITVDPKSAVGVIFSALEILAEVLSFIGYFLMVVHLGRALKVLNEEK